MANTVRIELTSKFLIYAVVLAAALLIGWELRTTAISVGAIIFMAFILNAGLRPAVTTLEEMTLKEFILLAPRWIGQATVALAKVFGEEAEARQILVTSKGEVRQWWRNIQVGREYLQIVDKFLGRNIPRGVAIFGMFVVIFTVVFTILFLLASEVVRQVATLLRDLPEIVKNLIELLDNSVPIIAEILPLDLLQNELGQFVNDALQSDFLRGLITGENAWSVVSETLGLFSSIAELLVTFVTVVIVSVYMLQYQEPVYEGLLSMFNSKRADRLRGLLQKIELKLGAWLNGQLFLMLMIGLITYILIIIPRFFFAEYTLDEYALPIALLAGLFEALPNIGPAITLVLTAILALGTSGISSVVYVIIAFTMLQQLEAVLIVPQVMKRAVGVDPIFSILGVIAGFQIGGVAGAVLAIPVIGIIQIVGLEVIRAYGDSSE